MAIISLFIYLSVGNRLVFACFFDSFVFEYWQTVGDMLYSGVDDWGTLKSDVSQQAFPGVAPEGRKRREASVSEVLVSSISTGGSVYDSHLLPRKCRAVDRAARILLPEWWRACLPVGRGPPHILEETGISYLPLIILAAMTVEKYLLKKMEYCLRMMHRIHFRSYEERRWSIKIGIVPASPSRQECWAYLSLLSLRWGAGQKERIK